MLWSENTSAVRSLADIILLCLGTNKKENSSSFICSKVIQFCLALYHEANGRMTVKILIHRKYIVELDLIVSEKRITFISSQLHPEMSFVRDPSNFFITTYLVVAHA